MSKVVKLLISTDEEYKAFFKSETCPFCDAEGEVLVVAESDGDEQLVMCVECLKKLMADYLSGE